MPLLDDVERDTTAVRVKERRTASAEVEEIVSALAQDKCFGEIKPAKTVRLARATRWRRVRLCLYLLGRTAGGA